MKGCFPRLLSGTKSSARPSNPRISCALALRFLLSMCPTRDGASLGPSSSSTASRYCSARHISRANRGGTGSPLCPRKSTALGTSDSAGGVVKKKARVLSSFFPMKRRHSVTGFELRYLLLRNVCSSGQLVTSHEHAFPRPPESGSVDRHTRHGFPPQLSWALVRSAVRARSGLPSCSQSSRSRHAFERVYGSSFQRYSYII